MFTTIGFASPVHWSPPFAASDVRQAQGYDGAPNILGALGGQVHKSLDIAKVAVGMGIPIPMGKG